MNDFFNRLSPKAEAPSHQPINPNQGLRMIHAPPLLPNSRGKKLSPPPILNTDLKLQFANNRDNKHQTNNRLSDEELTVTNLRKLYSSLLEEMAPLHHEIGTGGNDANYRWKNSGTVTVNGSDDDGYDYSYTPDNSKKSWRLQRNLPGAGGGGGNGITGGDWSKDGIRRYYTGGALEQGGGGHSSNIMKVGGIDVDVGTMNGVALSPKRNIKKEDDKLNSQFSIDSDSNASDEMATPGGEDKAKPDAEEDKVVQDHLVDIVGSRSSSMEDIGLESTPVENDNPASTSLKPNEDTPPINSGSISFGPSDNNNMTTFESLYHLSPAMAWRLRSAYSPKTAQEAHLISLGSEVLAQRSPEKADGIMKGLEVARECEARVCEGLRGIGELISYCERLKGTKFVALKRADNGRKWSRGASGETKTYHDQVPPGEEEEEEDVDVEAAEAMFAYFCEKNVLPMLIDSLLCHPPPLTSNTSDSSGKTTSIDNQTLPITNTTTISSAPSPFSGCAWTPAVKAQILQTISMILFNTSSPLSLTYLLSNNYMNELIMGMLPLDQWKDEALEEILPPYVTLLRGLTLRLRGEEGRCCLPLFLCQRPVRRRHDGGAQDDDNNTGCATETYLPLLYAAVQVFCSPFGTSLRDSEGCIIRTTAMNVILNLCRITDPEVLQVLVQGGGGDIEGTGSSDLPSTKSVPQSAPSAIAPTSLQSLLSHPLTVEQEMLFAHICNSINSWFHRSVRLVMASLSLSNNINSKSSIDEAQDEAKARHSDIANVQFRELQYWLGFLDDLLSCDIRVWNARLVECFLREVVVGTVLFRWNRALDVIEMKGSGISPGSSPPRHCAHPSLRGGVAGGDHTSKVSAEVYKARAEARVSVVFLTQLFGMVAYSPLVRLVGAVMLHHKYPLQWCGVNTDDDDGTSGSGVVDFSKDDDGFFVVTPAINAMISKKSSFTNGEEADAGAGAGGRPPNTLTVDIVGEISHMSRKDGQELNTSPSSSTNNEMNHRALETVAAKHDFHELAENVEQINHYSDKRLNEKSNQEFAPSRHRAALLDMLSGDVSYSSDETILASMLLSTLLENDAIDDVALELFGVLPSATVNDEGDSPFEISIARYLLQDWSSNTDESYVSLVTAIECVSTSGFMLLERLIGHTWTEAGECTDVVPFDHYYKSSKFIQALGKALSQFASVAQTHLDDDNSIHEIFGDLIRERYSSSADDVLILDGSIHSSNNEEPIRMFCSLQKYYPSTFIETASVLAGDIVGGDCNKKSTSPAGTDLFLYSDDNESARFAIRSLLHLRSLFGCIKDFYQRFTSSNSITTNSLWYGDEGGTLSFHTTEEAEEILLSIGCIQTSSLPEVGNDIDIRGRKHFRCSFPRKSKFGRSNSVEIIIDANGTRIVVTERADLVLVVDPREIFVTKAKKDDVNRCTVLAVIPLRTIIASATEGELFHIVCHATNKHLDPQENMLKNGRLSVKFESGKVSNSVKECVDMHCSAYERKIGLDISDMLEKCSIMGSENSRTKQTEDWSDFQQA